MVKIERVASYSIAFYRDVVLLMGFVVVRAGGALFGCCAGCSGRGRGCGCSGRGCGAGRVDGQDLGRAGGRGVDGGRDALQQGDQDRVGGVPGRGDVGFVHAESDRVPVGVAPYEPVVG